MVAFHVARAVALVCSSAIVTASQTCDGDFHSLKLGTLCTTTWAKMNKGAHRMRPTEPSVGYAWVVHQMRDHFHSVKSSQKWFGKHTLPVVIHGDDFYLTDHHHHAVAIQLTGDDNIFDLEMTLEIAADYRGIGDQFWPTMEDNGYAFLFSIDDSKHDSQLVKIDPSAMPTDWVLTNYADNIWRGLAAFSSHIDDEASRCYVQTCTWFVDFEWGYIFSTATYKDSSLWVGGGRESFSTMVESLPLRPTVQMVDEDTWSTVSMALLPLCHSNSIKDYPLPDGFPSNSLDGWSTVPLPADPDCGGVLSASLTLV